MKEPQEGEEEETMDPDPPLDGEEVVEEKPEDSDKKEAEDAN